MLPRRFLAAAILLTAHSAVSADRTLSVTIYPDDLALIQDRRDIDVKGGRQRVEFEDAVEIDMGPAPDVQVPSAREGDAHRIEITNARAAEIDFELKLRLPEGTRIVRADRALASKNGRPILRLKVPAQSTVVFRYHTERART